MRKAVFLALVMGILFVAWPTLSEAGDQDFVLINRTGFDIVEVYVSPANTKEWGEDVMDADILEDGQQVEISFENDEEECLWDLMAKDEEGDAVYWEKIDLCRYGTITLHYQDGKAWATFE